MPWVLRGLRDGVVTTRYPRRPDRYPASWQGAIDVVADDAGHTTLPALCPTGAIAVAGDRVWVDRGACILCGSCVRARPDVFRFTAEIENAGLGRRTLVVPLISEIDEDLARIRRALAARVRALRRSVHVRHVDAGSDGSEEWEVAALLNPVYDVHRLGIFFTASPRHADLLLVTGAGAHGMAAAVRETREQMPDPVVVIAAGTDAVSGGLVHPSYAVDGGVGRLVDVDVWVPGSPPSPFSLLHGILLALDRLPTPRSEVPA